MTTTNDITGDAIRSKANSRAFRDNFDRIFGQRYKVTYCREEGEKMLSKTITISAANLTEAVHEAENRGWVKKGWHFVGVEKCDAN